MRGRFQNTTDACQHRLEEVRRAGRDNLGIEGGKGGGSGAVGSVARKRQLSHDMKQVRSFTETSIILPVFFWKGKVGARVRETTKQNIAVAIFLMTWI